MRDDDQIDVVDDAFDDAVLVALAKANAEAPPARLGRRLEAAVAAEMQSRQTRATLRRWRVVGAVAAGLAVALGGVTLRSDRLAVTRAAESRALASENAALAARLESQARTLAAVRELVESQGGVFRILAGPRPLVAVLEAKLDVPASGRVVVDATSGATAVLLAGLDPALRGKVYELWAIRGSRAPEPAGLLTIAADGSAWARVDPVPRPAELTAFAVSIEPSGGSPAPTGPIVLAGSVVAG